MSRTHARGFVPRDYSSRELGTPELARMLDVEDRAPRVPDWLQEEADNARLEMRARDLRGVLVEILVGVTFAIVFSGIIWAAAQFGRWLGWSA